MSMTGNEHYQRRQLIEALRDVIDFKGHRDAFGWINDDRTVKAFEQARKLLKQLGELGEE